MTPGSKSLKELLGTHVAKTPSDSTFRLLLSQLDVDGFDTHLQQWMAAQADVTESGETLENWPGSATTLAVRCKGTEG